MFAASHRLHSEKLTAEENRATFGKCNNPHGHGHNYFLEVTVSGPVDKNGMVCDLAELDRFIHDQVVERYDLQHLNTMPEFGSEVPTTENLCIQIYDRVRNGFRQANLEKIRIEETLSNSFEYSGDHPVRM